MNDKDTERLCRNLQDAGCDAVMTEQFLAFQREGKIRDQRGLLLRQRNTLLHTVHENQKRIDCLDFLLYSMDAKLKSPKGGKTK